MSTPSTPTMDALDDGGRRQARRVGCGGGNRRWTPINTTVMVLGFVFFWPVGLLLLFWILSGRDVRELPQAVRETWGSMMSSWPTTRERADSDNVVFNDYQRTQYERIREIKDEISERTRRFNEFRSDIRRRKDQEEFDRFMASAPERPGQ